MVTEPLAPVMSDQMAWDVIYDLAMKIAQKQGAIITESARYVGPYAFVAAIEQMGNGLTLTWEGRQ